MLKQKAASLADQITLQREKTDENADRLLKLADQRDRFYEKQDGLGISKESFADVLKTLQSQRVQLMIDLAGMEARRESLAEIREKQIVEKLDSSVLELHTKLIEFQRKKRDQSKLLAEQGSLSAAELRTTEIEYLNAQLKLATAKNSIAVSPKLNDELLNVSLDRAEKRARLEKTESLLEVFTESRTSLLKSDEISEDLKSAKRQQTILQANLANLDTQLNAVNEELKRVVENEY